MKISWDCKILICFCGLNYLKLKFILICYLVISVFFIFCYLILSLIKNKERKYIKVIFYFKDKYGCQFFYRFEYLINILFLFISIYICEGKVYLNIILYLKICRFYDGFFVNIIIYFIFCKLILVFRVVGKIMFRVIKNYIMDFI